MKKFFLMLAVALPMFFMASCGDDNDEDALSLDQISATMDYGKTIKLTPSEKKGEWESTNEFVATVDKDGNVKAEHVGKATIKYLKDGQTATCAIIVNATNTYFDTPQNWGSSVAQVKSSNFVKEMNLFVDKPDQLMYAINSDLDYPWYGFLFENDKLDGSSINFPTTIGREHNFTEYYTQHYKEIESEEDENGDPVRVFINANTVSEASLAMKLSVELGEENIYIATTMPATHVNNTKSATDNVAQRAVNLFHEAKKINNLK
ncbi:MAG: Ig-like domain-containing protein [Muribaculaceae bacterium]|nr:Ig-like domain-containing protein [Muribaculaceae bacterium]